MRYQAPFCGLKIAIIMRRDNHNATAALTGDDFQRFYQTLEHSGLQYYWPRKQPRISLRHPLQPTLSSEHPIFCAKVLVLLTSSALQQLNTEATLILKGMLKVLSLKKDECCIAYCEPKTPLSVPSITQWAPHSLLLLGTVFKTLTPLLERDLNIPIVQSYAPLELAENPALKREAYNDLLHFKSTLIQ